MPAPAPLARPSLHVRRLALLLAAACATTADAVDEPTDAGRFVSTLRMTGATMSPDRRILAMTMAAPDTGRIRFVAMDVATRKLALLRPTHPRMVAAELAPDGQTVALPMAANATSRVRLIALDVKTAKFTSLAGFEDADIADFHWVNAHRLVFGVRDRDAPVGDVDTVSGLQTRRRPVT